MSSAEDDEDNQNTLTAATEGPFSHLPLELVVQIFVLCSHTGDPLVPLTLVIVCKWWREVCMSSPQVWQLIAINTVFRSISFIRTQSELWIARSYPLSFDIEIHLADCEAFLPILSYLLPHISRWRGCKIVAGDRTFQTCLSGFSQSSADLVPQHLHMQLRRPMDENQDADVSSFFSYTRSTAGIVSMKIAASKLPSAQLLNPLRFTSLDISESSSRHAVRSPVLLQFLQQCPNLERFSLRGVSQEERILRTPPPVIALPRLHTLTLERLCIQRSVLSHLHLPALRRLHLRQLNMDFSLRDYHVEEPGDSDDEAQDFSQSSSSDHHTGMGMRQLISRSRPPLEILEMDLSDMRTKDFAWVFDRTPLLKEFSIVGSDMSDKVIRLLKPIPITSGDEGSNAHQQQMRLRLPRLTTLKLFSCQQFSGDALVDALTTRTQYTDTVTPNETLTGITIVGCIKFRPRHERELFWHLRDRLYVG
ncbi:hypothetical protein V8B97DRAFT_1952213 [Scleroderma yunnanense]